MKLSTFIHDNLDAIIGEWQEFARTLLPAAKTMSDLALRNHSREILVAIVKDMEEVQTDAEQSARSRQAAPPPKASETIAAAHGALRYAAGFDLAQVVSEFRAMRTSVLALWRRRETTRAATPAIEEIARFNEAIDQALGESVERYSAELAQAHDMFLAVLGHDLRSPLAGIEMSGRVLEMPALSETARVQAALRVRRASKTMNGLIADLLEYTQSRLGRGIPIERSDCDLRRRICEDALDAVKESHPEQQFIQHLSGDLRVSLDVRRIQQMLSNLLDNAAHHGDRNAPVSLTARAADDAVVLEVANSGTPIPADALKLIFEPMVQVPSTTTELHRRPKTSVGLGLFIVRAIVRGHHGTIDVRSSADGTVFTIRLPRAAGAESAGSSDSREIEPDTLR